MKEDTQTKEPPPGHVEEEGLSREDRETNTEKEKEREGRRKKQDYRNEE